MIAKETFLAEDDNGGDNNFSKLSYKIEDSNRSSQFGENSLVLYPNPTNGEVFIESSLTSTADELSISIMDTKGRVIKQQNLGEASFMGPSFDLTEYPRGEYIIALSSNSGMRQAQRIIKY